MKLKAAILLALALFAFAVPAFAALDLSSPKLYNVSSDFIEDNDPPSQPEGDPVEGGGFPH